MKCSKCEKTEGCEWIRLGGMEYWLCLSCSQRTDNVVDGLKRLFRNQQRVAREWERA